MGGRYVSVPILYHRYVSVPCTTTDMYVYPCSTTDMYLYPCSTTDMHLYPALPQICICTLVLPQICKSICTLALHCRRLVSATPQPLYPQKRDLLSIESEGRVSLAISLFGPEKSAPTAFRTPDLSAPYRVTILTTIFRRPYLNVNPLI
jgi:hypothetical protein